MDQMIVGANLHLPCPVKLGGEKPYLITIEGSRSSRDLIVA
jgi:hypothetical protein